LHEIHFILQLLELLLVLSAVAIYLLI